MEEFHMEVLKKLTWTGGEEVSHRKSWKRNKEEKMKLKGLPQRKSWWKYILFIINGKMAVLFVEEIHK